MKSAEQGKMIKEIDAFVRQLDESVRLEAFKFLLAQECKEGPGSTGPARRESGTEKGRQLSPQELIRICRVSSLMDKAIVLAYWLEEHQKRESFSSIDLRDAFTAAREPAPANPSDVVAKLDGAGKVMKADKLGKMQNYRLTATGIKEVEGWLNPEPETGEQK